MDAQRAEKHVPRLRPAALSPRPRQGGGSKGKGKGKGKGGGKSVDCFICGGDHFARDCPEAARAGVGFRSVRKI